MRSTRRSPLARLARRVAGVPLCVTALACGGAAAPAPNTGVTPAPARAVVVRPFAYAPGRLVYELRNETVVYSPGDTTRRIDSLSSVAIVTYALERTAAGALSVTGAVDSFSVATTSSATGASSEPRQMLQQPIRFTAQLDSTGALRAFAGEQTPDCTTPAGALLVAARDLFVALPARPAVGAQWTDSTTSTVCRGNIPVTTKALQRYEVVQNDTTLRVRRASTITISGMGTQRGVQVTISGNGTATTDLTFDPARGQFTGSSSDYEAQLQFQAGALAQPFIQRVRQRVVLRR